MSITRNSLKRPAAALSALALVVGTAAPAFLGMTGQVYAAQAQNRAIKMDNATPGATSVRYELTFQTTADQAGKNIQGIVVDFCGGNASDTPFIGDSNCTIPTGMVVPNSGTAADVAGVNAGTWTVANGTAAHILTVTNASATTNVAGLTTVTMRIDGFTNPTTEGTFYARIATFTTTAGATAYTSATPGSYTDYGGIALSIAPAVVITAKVQESLVFCLSSTIPTALCAANINNPNVNLGDQVGTTNNYILTNSNTVYSGTVNSQLTTNALHGAIVRVKTTSSTACAGLSSDSGTSCTNFPAKGAAATFDTGGTGSAGFGMCVAASSVTAAAPFNGSNCAAKDSSTQWGLNDTIATTVAPNYGDTLYSTTAPVKNANNPINYGVMAVDTTPAGIYTTTQTMIATGTF